MSITLPKEINYAEVLPSISNASNIQHTLLPINGQNFELQNQGTVIQFDFPSQHLMDPNTLFLRYKYKISSSGETEIRGCPAISFAQRLQVLFGSSIVENINDYNVIEHMKTNISLDISQKLGQSISFGYRGDNNAVSSFNSVNGGHFETNSSGYLSFPVSCILSKSEKLIPLGLMSQIRLQFFCDSISNIFAPARDAILADPTNGIVGSSAIVLPTSFVLSDMQLCYNSIDMGPTVMDTIRNDMGETLYIKSSSWNSSQTTLPAGTSGSTELVFNSRYASVKSLFMHTSSNNTNGKFDSFFFPGVEGAMQFNIAGKYYPQRPIVMASLIPNLKLAVGSIQNRTNSMSISNSEFLCTLGVPTTTQIISKQYVGVNTCVVPFSALLSGVSTESSPISVRCDITTTTPTVCSPSLLVHFDVIIAVDPLSKNCSVKQ